MKINSLRRLLLPVACILLAACAGPRYSGQFRQARDLYRSGDAERAEKAFALAVAMAERKEDTETLAQTFSELGWMQAELGRYPEAVRLMRRAIEVSRGPNYNASIHYARLGALQARMGFYDAGLISARLALDVVVKRRRELSRKLEGAGRLEVLDQAMKHPGLPPDVPMIKGVTAAEGAEATIHYLRGDYAKAVEIGERAMRHFADISGLIKMANSEEKRSYNEGYGLTMLAVGDSLLRLGKIEDGRDLLYAARGRFAKAKYLFGDLIAEGLIAYSHILQGDYAEGSRLAQPAFDRITQSRIDEIIWRMRFEFAQALTLEADRVAGRFDELERATDNYRIRELRGSLKEQKTLKGLPLIGLLAKDQAVRMNQVMEELDTLSEDRAAAAAKGRELVQILKTVAYESALVSIKSVESLRGQLETDLNKRMFLGDKRRIYELAILLAFELKTPAEALELCERARSRGLVDLFAGQALAGESADLAEEAEVRHALQSDYLRATRIRDGLIRRGIQLDTSEARKTLAPVNGNIEDKETRYRDILAKLRRKIPETLSLISPQHLAWDELAAAVPAGTDLLYYYAAKDRLIVWTLGQDGLKAETADIKRADLSALVQDYREAVLGRRRDDEMRLAKKLYDILIRPYAHAGSGDLLVIPHDSLHYLPFAALSDGSRRLVDARSLSYGGSLTTLLHLRGRKNSESAKAVLVGNPKIGEGTHDLPHAQIETTEIAKLYPEHVLLQRDKAGRREVLAHADAGIFHFATHGEYDPSEPLLSGLLLAGPTPAQGMWTAADILRAPLPARLTVLSACKTALGYLAAGDEIIGLNRSLFHAGVGAVVSSLWSVEDKSTSLLMTALHEHLRGGAPAHRALSLAQRTLRKREEYSDPFFWAAFGAYGGTAPPNTE